MQAFSQSFADDVDEKLNQAFSKKDGLCLELTLLKDRFTKIERMLGLKWTQRAAAQWALVEAKVLWAREDKRVKFAKEEVVKKVKLYW